MILQGPICVLRFTGLAEHPGFSGLSLTDLATFPFSRIPIPAHRPPLTATWCNQMLVSRLTRTYEQR